MDDRRPDSERLAEREERTEPRKPGLGKVHPSGLSRAARRRKEREARYTAAVARREKHEGRKPRESAWAEEREAQRERIRSEVVRQSATLALTSDLTGTFTDPAFMPEITEDAGRVADMSAALAEGGEP